MEPVQPFEHMHLPVTVPHRPFLQSHRCEQSGPYRSGGQEQDEAGHARPSLSLHPSGQLKNVKVASGFGSENVLPSRETDTEAVSLAVAVAVSFGMLIGGTEQKTSLEERYPPGTSNIPSFNTLPIIPLEDPEMLNRQVKFGALAKNPLPLTITSLVMELIPSEGSTPSTANEEPKAHSVMLLVSKHV